jgi:hypothetical protein
MGEQGDYRPPRGYVRSGQVSLEALEALEAAFGTTRQGPPPGSEPNGNGAVAGPAEAGGRRPDTGRPEPPWPAVAATTARLWLRRRGAALGRLFRNRWTITLAVLVVAALAAGGLVVSFPGPAGRAPAAGRTTARAGALAGAMGQNSGAGVVGHSAAVWVARQVSRGAVVGCDPGMCRVLQASGFPAASLLALRPGGVGLRLCDVIVATRAVRDLLGSRLQQEVATVVIAGFGSGEARIDVRAVSPGGAATYRAALAADWVSRRKAGAQLVGSPRVHAGGAARQELLAGQVDSRLLITLAAMAASHPVNVVAFSGSAPGAAAGVPLREMEISAAGSPASRSAELQRIRSLVLAQRAVFLPAHVGLVRLAGGPALQIEFGAPSPLGLLLGRPVTQ